MEFVKYKHIENTYATAACERYLTKHPELPNETWVATEKVDGANFQFCTDGLDIRCCSRNRVLTPTCQFYNFQEILEKYEASVKRVYARISADYGGGRCLEVRIYGELFGAFFPDEKADSGQVLTEENEDDGEPQGAMCQIVDNSLVEELRKVKVNAIRAVQKRVVYSPFVDFYLFDIEYRYVSGTEDGYKYGYLSMVELMELASKCGFPLVARPLHQGSYNEMIKLNPEFLTTIPEQLGYPQIADNFAEGYVLRPLDSPSSYRMKLKSARFAESMNIPHPEANGKKNKEKSSANHKVGLSKAELNLTENESVLLEELEAGVTRNRLASVVSKCEENELRRMDDRPLTALLLDDALDELLTDRPDLEEVFENIEKSRVRKIKGFLFPDSVNFVKENRLTL